MSREPFQVLVFLRKHVEGHYRFLLLKRTDMHVWQGVAGGVEDGETPKEAAVRETFEETGVQVNNIRQLSNVAMLSVLDVVGNYLWREAIAEIPEYAFVADIGSDEAINLSCEHEDSRWCDLEEAMGLLEWESNKAALKEACLMER